jgi:Ca-activated chloride channel homolog
MEAAGGKMKYGKIFIILLIIFSLNIPALIAQKTKTPEKNTRFLFLLDCSGSMWGEINKGGRQKIVAAKSILTRLLDSLQNLPNVQMALRVYGTSKKQDCKDTHLEVGFYAGNVDEIKEKVARLQPNGTTPIAYSLTQAADDFPQEPGKNIIILLTDGMEECKGDPCAVSQALQSRGVILRPFVIGLGMNSDYSKYFDCVGKYFNAATESDLQNILSTVITQALNNTTLQVNLNDIYGKPTETNVDMTFYNAKNKTIIYNYYHTLNEAGNPDTLKVDPLLNYNIKIHTTPPLYKNDVEVISSRHNIVNIDAAQGELELDVTGSDYYNLKCLVKRGGTQEIVYVQDFNTNHKYLVGSYDLEILTVPRIQISKVKIDQSKTSKIEVPQPGKVEMNFASDVVASIYIMRNNKQEWVEDVFADALRKEVFTLQPGNYKVVYRPRNSHNTIESKQADYKIKSGTYISLNLD